MTPNCRLSLARAFIRWLRADRSGLRDEIVFEQRRHRVMLRLKRLPELHGAIGRDAISIWTTRRGRCWSAVFELSSRPVGTAGGWHDDASNVVFADRVTLWTALLFEPFRAWVLGPLKDCNCIEFIARDDDRQVRLQPDKEVPYRLRWEKDRYWRKRARLASHASQDKLAALDAEHDRLIDELWADFREPVDYDELERIALAALGPEGIAYLNGLTDDDFKPFDIADV